MFWFWVWLAGFFVMLAFGAYHDLVDSAADFVICAGWPVSGWVLFWAWFGARKRERERKRKEKEKEQLAPRTPTA